MKPFFKNSKSRAVFQWTVLLLAFAVLALSLWYFIADFQSLTHKGYMRPLRHRASLQRTSPDQIRGWMTFKYVNLIFNLPYGYLQSELNITDKRYPNLSINNLAKAQKISSGQILQKTISAVKSYSTHAP